MAATDSRAPRQTGATAVDFVLLGAAIGLGVIAGFEALSGQLGRLLGIVVGGL